MKIHNRILFLSFVILSIKSTNLVKADLPAEEIIGGNIAKHESYPYQVVIVSISENVQSSCGGSILDDYHVLSAAHCVYNTTSKNWHEFSHKVVAGVDDFSNPSDRSNSVTANVNKIYVPAVYVNDVQNNAETKKGDIAVLKLDRSLNVTDNGLETVLLPSTIGHYSSFENEDAVVSGYGGNSRTVEKNEFTGELEWVLKFDGKFRDAHATVLANSDCQDKWNNYTTLIDGIETLITDKHLCALVDQRNSSYHEGVCKGDSGGPLVYDDLIQIGVVSFVPANPLCDEKFAPTVYTRVSAFEDFIKKALEDNHVDPEIKDYVPPINEDHFKSIF